MSRIAGENTRVYKGSAPRDDLRGREAPPMHPRRSSEFSKEINDATHTSQEPAATHLDMTLNTHIPSSVLAAYDEKHKTRLDARQSSEPSNSPPSFYSYDSPGRILADIGRHHRDITTNSVGSSSFDRPLSEPDKHRSHSSSNLAHPKSHIPSARPSIMSHLSAPLHTSPYFTSPHTVPPHSPHPTPSTAHLPISPLNHHQPYTPAHPAVVQNCAAALTPIRQLYEQAWYQTVTNVQAEMSRMHNELLKLIDEERSKSRRLSQELEDERLLVRRLRQDLEVQRKDNDILKLHCQKLWGGDEAFLRRREMGHEPAVELEREPTTRNFDARLDEMRARYEQNIEMRHIDIEKAAERERMVLESRTLGMKENQASSSSSSTARHPIEAKEPGSDGLKAPKSPLEPPLLFDANHKKDRSHVQHAASSPLVSGVFPTDQHQERGNHTSSIRHSVSTSTVPNSSSVLPSTLPLISAVDLPPPRKLAHEDATIDTPVRRPHLAPLQTATAIKEVTRFSSNERQSNGHSLSHTLRDRNIVHDQHLSNRIITITDERRSLSSTSPYVSAVMALPPAQRPKSFLLPSILDELHDSPTEASPLDNTSSSLPPCPPTVLQPFEAAIDPQRRTQVHQDSQAQIPPPPRALSPSTLSNTARHRSVASPYPRRLPPDSDEAGSESLPEAQLTLSSAHRSVTGRHLQHLSPDLGEVKSESPPEEQLSLSRSSSRPRSASPARPLSASVEGKSSTVSINLTRSRSSSPPLKLHTHNQTAPRTFTSVLKLEHGMKISDSPIKGSNVQEPAPGLPSSCDSDRPTSPVSAPSATLSITRESKVASKLAPITSSAGIKASGTPYPFPLKQMPPSVSRRANTAPDIHSITHHAKPSQRMQNQRKRNRTEYEYTDGVHREPGQDDTRMLKRTHTPRELNNQQKASYADDDAGKKQQDEGVAEPNRTSVKDGGEWEVESSPSRKNEKKPKGDQAGRKTWTIGIRHLDLLYETRDDTYVCRVCRVPDKDAKPPIPPTSMPKTTSWNVLCDHYRDTHSQAWTELERRPPNQVTELLQRLSGSGMTGHILR